MEEQNKQEALLAALLEKFLAGTCTEEEKQVVEQWYATYEDKPDQQPSPVVMAGIYDELLQRLPERQVLDVVPPVRRRIPVWVAAAAAVSAQWQPQHQ